MNTPNFSACIFDFDGVIIDSEPLHARAKALTLDHFHIPYPPDLFSRFKGRTDQDFFEYVAAELADQRASFAALDNTKRSFYLQLFEFVPLVTGVETFVHRARKQYKKLGMATSATGHDYALAKDRFQINDWFDTIITGADTTHHKPHPEPYLKCLEVLQVPASETLVIEDSPNGIHSARAAGCKIAAITTSFPAETLNALGVDYLAESFETLQTILGFDAAP